MGGRVQWLCRANTTCRLYGTFQLPTPSGIVAPAPRRDHDQFRLAGRHDHAQRNDYTRLWNTSEAAALEVNLQPGCEPGLRVCAPCVARSVHVEPVGANKRTKRHQQPMPALAKDCIRSARYRTLLLIAAALAVAAALSATVWQRRSRLGFAEDPGL